MKLAHYIAGAFYADETEKYLDVINPATSDTIAQVPMATIHTLDVAISAAEKGQKEWANIPAPKRSDYLLEIGVKLKEKKEFLAEVLTKEMGKVIEEARGEIQEGIDMAFYMAGEGRRLLGETTPSELNDKFAMSVRTPVGIIGLITPWNFPIGVPLLKALPAIVSGNAIVWKPASETPIIAYEMAKIFDEVGLPQGVVNVVFGSGTDIGTEIVQNPHIGVISFTGSTSTGRKVAELGGYHLKKVSLELGGKNAVIVMDDADLDLAVEGIIWSAFGTAGQRCTACSRVIVHKDIEEALQQKLLSEMEKLTIGDGLDERNKVGPVINMEALYKIHSYVELAQLDGATLLTGGHILEGGDYDLGCYYAPTLFKDVRPDARLAQEEIFGPVVGLIRVGSLEEAIEVNNNVSYGLSSSIYTKDVNTVFRAQRDLDTGIVYVNAGTTGAEVHLPFGGTKGTGNGHRDSGVSALDLYTEVKSIYIDFSGKLQRAQIDN
ncbi:aldehyde dehydrogenase family protein [Kurthia senegalensis]|uniref:aldehyde dehydrogenase family protein n=1 Tax=Kurthia senegalensis TaxID=1033740 RepID=UPI0002891E28|nr:aldehyde dehydrogenase family protein [Kurthia senegalensis]